MDLGAVPGPARDLTQDVIDHDGLVCISTSRGCYAQCAFCSVPRFYGLEKDRPRAVEGWLARSAAYTVGEIMALHERFGLVELLVVDDEFFGGNEAGHLRARTIGDSLTQLRSLGLSFQPGFMLFNHRATLDEVRANVEFLAGIDELKPVTVNSAVDPHFGAPINRVIQRDGSLIAGLQSAVTFEWRRRVPGRSPRVTRTIDAFERSCNQAFVQVFVDALEGLAASPGERARDVLADVESSLARVEERMALAKALLLGAVGEEEGVVKYFTQNDIIAERGVG